MTQRKCVTWEEPHAKRRKESLASHPEIARLQGPEWRSKYICLFALVLPQLYLSTVVPGMQSPWMRLFVWYALGCTITQSIFLAIHELSHNLFFHRPHYNRMFACIANLPIGVPFAIAFRTYHLRHHAHQGRLGVDGDVPTEWECRLVNAHWSVRLMWLSLQIVMYAVRPLLTTNAIPLSRDLLMNWTLQIVFNILWIRSYGLSSYLYLIACVVGAGSLHPCAGHFVSEHYGWGGDESTQETFSYYGALNCVTWNVGYHNEHHDFPLVPWSRLPILSRKLTSRYSTLKTYSSWTMCLVHFVTRPMSYRIVR